MPRAGRSLETLVAILEKAFDPLQVKVYSPAYITGHESGSRRELDVAVRGRLGTADVFVMIECRDRVATEEVSWIEQLATKMRDVRANKTIAVSSSGFSSGAASLAAAESIELRTMQTLDLGHPFSWLGLTHLNVQLVRFGLGGIRVQLLQPDDEVITAFDSRPLESHDEELFIDKLSGKTLSPNDILRLKIGDAPSREVSIPADGSVITQSLQIRFAGDEVRYQVEGPAGLIDVHGIEFDVLLTGERARVPLERLSQYACDESVLAESAEFHFMVDGERHVLSLHLLKELEALTASLRLE